MKRKSFIVLAVAVLVAAMLVSCDGLSEIGLTGTRGVSEYFSVAKEAFRLSTGVSIPDNDRLTLFLNDARAVREEINFLKDVIADGGSNDFRITFNLGVTLDAYNDICTAITGVYGEEKPNYPMHGDDYYYDMWDKNGIAVVTLYATDNSRITIGVFPSISLLAAGSGTTAFYDKAKEAFRLSTGVDLPDVAGLGLKTGSAYDLEMAELDDVIARGGSHSFNFDFNIGVNLAAYLELVCAAGAGFGVQQDGYPVHYQGWDINYWIKNGLSLMIKYHAGDQMSFIIQAL